MTSKRLTAISTLLFAGALLGGGCASGEPVALDCSVLPAPAIDSAVVLMIDQRSPAVDRVLAAIRSEPDTFGSAPDLGLTDTSNLGVIITTIGENGTVLEHGRFAINGNGDSDFLRKLDAQQQLQCLNEAANELATTGTGTPDLIRALPLAVDIGRSASGDGDVAVIASGLGRSGGDGVDIATVDLGTPEARATLLATLDEVGLLPDLTEAAPAVLLLDPAEGVGSGISAAAIEEFANDLCPALRARQCAARREVVS